jgi:hypothetical protein
MPDAFMVTAQISVRMPTQLLTLADVPMACAAGGRVGLGGWVGGGGGGVGGGEAIGLQQAPSCIEEFRVDENQSPAPRFSNALTLTHTHTSKRARAHRALLALRVEDLDGWNRDGWVGGSAPAGQRGVGGGKLTGSKGRPPHPAPSTRTWNRNRLVLVSKVT